MSKRLNPPKNPKGVRKSICVRIDPEAYEWLKNYAEAQGIGLGAALDDYILDPNPGIRGKAQKYNVTINPVGFWYPTPGNGL